MWIFFCYPLFFCFLVILYLVFVFCFFVNFGGLSLPCHLLCCLLLFVFLFFSSWIFCCFFFVCKFNCSWHFFTSSGHVPLVGWLHSAPFRGQVSKGSKLYNWWFGKASGLNDTNWWIWYFEETVDDGLGVRCLDVGRCPVSPPPGWSWLDDLGDGVNCFVFCLFLIFWKSIGIAGKVLEWKKGSLLNCCWVGRWIPQCFPKHYSCYDTDRTAEITDAPTS